MKKILILITALGIVANVAAQKSLHHSNFEGVRVSNVGLTHKGDTLHIEMIMELGSKDIRTTRATIYTPVLFNGDNELVLPSVGVYGRSPCRGSLPNRCGVYALDEWCRAGIGRADVRMP